MFMHSDKPLFIWDNKCSDTILDFNWSNALIQNGQNWAAIISGYWKGILFFSVSQICFKVSLK